MTSSRPLLDLSREQILAHRRAVQSLNRRLPPGADSLRRAAWAGLPDSMPRAALLSIHARVEGTTPSTWEDPSLVQLWGPGFSAYVVPGRDMAAFTLGRLPDGARARKRAEELAARLHAFLDGRRMPYGEAGRGIGVHPNALRYAAATGTVLIRWEGARQPTVFTVPAPEEDPHEARRDLARRYLHLYGPTTPEAFERWAGIKRAGARVAFDDLTGMVTPVRTPVGEGWILDEDERSFRARATPSNATRLLPSGDPYFLLHGAQRELLVPEAGRRGDLWTPRVWPGAVLVAGEVAGTWRRAGAAVTVSLWRRLGASERDALEAEVASLPLPGVQARLTSVGTR